MSDNIVCPKCGTDEIHGQLSGRTRRIDLTCDKFGTGPNPVCRTGLVCDHAARAAVSWWMVASYSAGLR